MPRAYDRQQLLVDRDPLKQATDFGNLPKLVFPNLKDWWESVVRLIKDTTGLDLSSPLAFFQSLNQVITDMTGLVFTSPAAFLASVIKLLNNLTGVDFSSPQAFFQSIVDMVSNVIQNIQAILQALADATGLIWDEGPVAFLTSLIDKLFGANSFFVSLWENLNAATGLTWDKGPVTFFLSILDKLGESLGLDWINGPIKFIQSMIAKLLENADAMFAPIVAILTGASGGMASLQTWVVGTLNTAITNVQSVIEQIWAGFGMGTWIDQILHPSHVAETMAAVNAAIVDLQQLIASLPSGVFEKFDTYPNGDSLTTKWEQKYFNGGGDVVGLSSGVYGISKGRAQFPTQLLINDRRCNAIYKPVGSTNQTGGDFQRVSIILGSAPQQGGLLGNVKAWNEIRGRIDANNTAWVFARMEDKKCLIGYKLNGSSEVILKQGSMTTKPAATYNFEIGLGATGLAARTFRLLENQTVILEAVDTLAKSQMGAAYRYCGMTAHAPSGVVLPGGVAAFSFYDSGGLSLVDGFGQALSSTGPLGVIVAPITDPEPEPEGVLL
jgi:hypothetical protein